MRLGQAVLHQALSPALLTRSSARSTSRLEELKQRYLAAGSPTKPDWDKLLEGL